MQMQIKELLAEDIELLVSLRMEVLSHVFETSCGQMSKKEWKSLEQENRRYYETELLCGGHVACAAYQGEELLGSGGICFYRELPSPDNLSGKCAYLMNIYTREAYRRNGVAKEICRWLIKKAKIRGAEKIYLETSEDGRVLYQRLGFSDMKDYMLLTDYR